MKNHPDSDSAEQSSSMLTDSTCILQFHHSLPQEFSELCQQTLLSIRLSHDEAESERKFCEQADALTCE